MNDGNDPHISLLEYRNTTTDVESPAKQLMSRQIMSIILITNKSTETKSSTSCYYQAKEKNIQNRHTTYFNVECRKLSSLSSGQRVRFRHKGQLQPGYQGSSPYKIVLCRR